MKRRPLARVGPGDRSVAPRSSAETNDGYLAQTGGAALTTRRGLARSVAQKRSPITHAVEAEGSTGGHCLWLCMMASAFGAEWEDIFDELQTEASRRQAVLSRMANWRAGRPWPAFA